MKKFLLLFFFVMCFSSTLKAMEALIPVEDLIQDSEIIVVGTLTNVSEHSKDDMDYGEGNIIVEEVLFGNVKKGEKLLLKWSNPSNLGCPRTEHSHHKNIKAIWLLNTSDKGEVYANHSGRFVRLSKLNLIKKIMTNTKVSLYSDELFVKLNEPLNVTLKIRNYSHNEKRLPGFEVKDGILFLNPDLKLNLSMLPSNYSQLVDYEKIPLKPSERVIISKDVPPIVIPPKTDVTFGLDLRPFFGSSLKRGETYTASFKFRGHSESDEAEFIIESESAKSDASTPPIRIVKDIYKAPAYKFSFAPLLRAFIVFDIALLLFVLLYKRRINFKLHS